MPNRIEAARVWRLPQTVGLYWEQWGDEYLLYNSASGATHLLNEVGARALQTLSIKSVDTEVLTECLTEEFAPESFEKFHKSLIRLLSDFSRLGLVETAPGELA